LAAPANVGFARRSAIGVELSRLNMILAVLDRKAGISLISQDVYVNVVGGLRLEGTSTDLAVAMAIYSAYRGVKSKSSTLAVGEIGLTGDLRTVQNVDKIVKESAKMGFTQIIMPNKNAGKLTDVPKSIKVIGVKNLREAIGVLV
ncbi:MAG: magnesium chelatase domain-containing protein, partial [Anaerovorax sp.]